MDDTLVQRWRGGDGTAALALRNSVRSTALRVFSHPVLMSSLSHGTGARLRNEDARRDLTVKVAEEVLQRGPRNAAQVQAVTLMVAGRHVIEALQEGRAVSEEAHLPPQVAVTLALAPDSVSGQVRDAAHRHVGKCRACDKDVRVLGEIVRTHRQIDPHTDAADISRTVAVHQNTSAADLAASMHAAVDSIAPEDAPEPGLRPRGGGPARASKRPPPPDKGKVFSLKTQRGANRKSAAARDTGRRWSLVKAGVPLVLVLGALAWYAFGHTPETEGPQGPLAALADRNPPEVHKLGELPRTAQAAVADLAGGDCRTAAGRFRSARTGEAIDIRLMMLEGAAFVCAGDARRANRAFAEMDQVLEDPGDRPKASHWYVAQAHLLAGDSEAALAALSAVEVVDARRRRDARALAERIRGG